jgi:predicted RecA/RadA family phage recombinase
MKNFIQTGDSLTFTAAAAVTAGDGILQGALFGVATTNAASGDEFTAALTGVYELPKAAGALTLGQRAYWHPSNANITGTASGATLVGAVAEAAADAATVVKVRLNGTA